MPNRILLYIPIYAESPNEYRKKISNTIRKFSQTYKKQLEELNLPKEIFESSLDEAGKRREDEFVGWRFNRIVGWIEIYSDGCILKANLNFTKLKKIPLVIKRNIIEYKGKIGDIASFQNLSNSDIANRLQDFLMQFQNGDWGKSYSKRYIDINYWSSILKQINYNAFLNCTNMD